jgi:type II secretory pathway component PulF
MPEYVYRAVTEKGQIVRNRVEDVSKNTLIKRLKSNNLLPISVSQVGYRSAKKHKSKKRNVTDIDDIMKMANSADVMQGRRARDQKLSEKVSLALSLEERITERDVRIFTQNFFLLKKANFNNIHALYINMIKVGELSGSLTQSLQQAVKYLDDTSSRNRKLKAILIPNLVQFIAIIVLLFVGTIYVLPLIQDVFEQVGSSMKLPDITLWFMDFVDIIMAYWYVPVIIIAAIAAGIFWYINTPRGRYNFDYFKYKMPIFGSLIYAIDFSRLMRAMLLNLQNGMRIQESLEVSKSVVKNYVMLSIIESSINNILIGGSWIEPFENSGLSSAMETEMLKIGMQTDLSEMMAKLLDYMDIDIDNKMQKIMKVLPEISYAFVGAILIFLVVVVLVPCIQLYMGNWLIDAMGV